ncbi:MAG: hypothetical protein QM752_03700 [Gammaproteobacteria bacterium]
MSAVKSEFFQYNQHSTQNNIKMWHQNNQNGALNAFIFQRLKNLKPDILLELYEKCEITRHYCQAKEMTEYWDNLLNGDPGKVLGIAEFKNIAPQKKVSSLSLLQNHYWYAAGDLEKAIAYGSHRALQQKYLEFSMQEAKPVEKERLQEQLLTLASLNGSAGYTLLAMFHLTAGDYQAARMYAEISEQLYDDSSNEMHNAGTSLEDLQTINLQIKKYALTHPRITSVIKAAVESFQFNKGDAEKPSPSGPK